MNSIAGVGWGRKVDTDAMFITEAYSAALLCVDRISPY
jgi:hypothetical protein